MPDQKKNDAGKMSGFKIYANMILQHADIPKKTIIFNTIVSGLVNAILLSTLNSAANSAGEGTVNIRYLAAFGIALLIFFVTKRYILRQSVEIVEHSVYNLRLRILNKLRQCDLSSMESIGKDQIFTRVSNDTNFISQSAAMIINGFQAAILVFFALIYIAVLSLTAFFVTILVLVLAVSYYFRRQKEVNEAMMLTNKHEAAFYDHIENLVEGFKELKLSSLKNEQLYVDIKQTALEGKDNKVKNGLHFAVGFMFSEMVFYLLLACVVFMLPQFLTMYAGTLTRLTASILFIIGPLENIVTTIPLFIKAIYATRNIQQLETQIQSLRENDSTKQKPPLPPFEELRLEKVCYEYIDEENQSSFSLGPIDLVLKKGELVCIVGGNGSGKSTMLKVLTNLYHRSSGKIFYNGKDISLYDDEEYRSVFSAIFTDFHLFPKIYGVKDLNEEKVNEYINLMALSHKTHFQGLNFSNVRLSTGQRKRLALICVLLEDNPVMILDEVTADQDPEFKKFYYLEILSSLRKRGKTVMMVSHDDKYAEQFDRIIEMEYGKIISK
jgi:putative ATP-binding cassette transporter